MSVTVKKIFRHGGSYAVDIPMDYVRKNGVHDVILEVVGEKLTLRAVSELDTIESEPLFGSFIRALAVDAMKHPDKLRQTKEVWDKDWERLLKGVKTDE